MNSTIKGFAQVLALCSAFYLTTVLAEPQPQPTEVLVMGMIHSGHLSSKRWNLAAVGRAIRRIHPDVVCAEIPPDRWDEVWRVYQARHVIEDSRVKRFPEYTDELLPLKKQLGFQVEPCAAWTQDMSDARNVRIHEFETDPRWADRKAAYDEENRALQARHKAFPIDEDDPLVIHSEEYDRRTREELEIYDRTLNDFIGPGGWTNINHAHYRLIDVAIRRHPGQRMLIMFGAGHKYWILDQLRRRHDIVLRDIRPYLVGKPGPAVKLDTKTEILRLHRFFQDWFRGDVANSAQQFERFSAVMDPDFEIISPSGKRTAIAQLAPRLKKAYGSETAGKPPFLIEIRNFQERASTSDLHLASYEEWQRRNGHWRGRISTVTFRINPQAPHGLRWLQVHETWLPDTQNTP